MTLKQRGKRGNSFVVQENVRQRTNERPVERNGRPTGPACYRNFNNGFVNDRWMSDLMMTFFRNTFIQDDINVQISLHINQDGVFLFCYIVFYKTFWYFDRNVELTYYTLTYLYTYLLIIIYTMRKLNWFKVPRTQIDPRRWKQRTEVTVETKTTVIRTKLFCAILTEHFRRLLNIQDRI